MEEDGHDLTPEQKNFIPKLTPTHILMFATGACGIPAVVKNDDTIKHEQ